MTVDDKGVPDAGKTSPTTAEMRKKIEDLTKDPQAFSSFIYTPLEEAITEAERRRKDKSLKIGSGTPFEKSRSSKIRAVLFRHIATPNYETRRFVHIVSVLRKLQPLFLEYTADKFTNRNECKFALAKIPFYKGKNKNGESLFEYKNIININENNCHPINTVKTHWGEELVSFHHKLFLECFPDLDGRIYDLSDWVKQNGSSAKEYYKIFLSIFLKQGILFENFLLNEEETPFHKEVVLPALMEIIAETGLKPLIVALAPTEIEGEHFWQAHPLDEEERVEKMLQTALEKKQSNKPEKKVEKKKVKGGIAWRPVHAV